MVRLVWFPGYVDWERRKYTWGIRGANADVRGVRSFAQCVAIPSHILSESFSSYAEQGIALRGHREVMKTQMDLDKSSWLVHHHLHNDIMVDMVTAEVKEDYCGSKKA